MELTNTSHPDYIAQLLEEEQRIKSELANARSASKSNAINHIKELMKVHGVTIGDLTGRKGEKAPVLYKGPNGESWSGRGKSPKWINDLLSIGHTKESLMVKHEAQTELQPA